MQSRTREQPFFKPLSSQEDNNSYEIRQSNSWQRQSTRHEESQQQDFAVNGEKLTSLHAKLHQQADKIRKWKNQTEFDLKQKDQKILEGTHTIESLRKSILELQLQNENLSLKMQEEISSREEVMQRVNATRDLCAVLKGHSAQNEEALHLCKTKETELKYLEREHVKQFEELSEKFKTMTEAVTIRQNELINELSITKEAQERAELDLDKQTKTAEQEMNKLLKKCDEKDIEIRDIRSEIQRNSEKQHTLGITIDKLEIDLETGKEAHKTTSQKLHSLQEDFDTVKAQKESLEEKLAEKQAELDSVVRKKCDLDIELATTKEKHANEMASLEEQLQATQQEVFVNKNRNRFLETDLERETALLAETKSAKDMLMMEKTDLENKLIEMEKQNALLLSQQQEHCETLNQMSSHVKELQEKLCCTQQEAQSYQVQMNKLTSRLSQTENEKCLLQENINMVTEESQTLIESLKKDAADKCEQILLLTVNLKQADENFKTECNKHELVQTELKHIKQELKKSEKEVAAKSKEIAKCKSEIETLMCAKSSMQEELQKYSALESSLREEIDAMQKDIAVQEEQKEALLQQKETNDHALNDRIESSTKAATDLESKNKTLRNDVTTKNKQLKELEKELKSLKSKHTSNTKALEKRTDELQKVKDSLETEVELKQELADKIKDLEEVTTEARNEALAMKKLAEDSVRKKEEMFKKCEKQRGEMNSIMENYKSESDKIINQKDSEIESLAQTVSEVTTKHTKEFAQTEEKVMMLQQEVDLLRKKLSESGYQMENLQKNYGMKENQVQELEIQNSKQEEELKELQEQLEHLYIKKTTCATVQTSPAPRKHGETQYNVPKVYPKPNTNPQTPKAQIRSFEETRKTPSGMKTPQRSILKTLSANASNSVSKKRKVIFATTKGEPEVQSDEDSSSSDLMELEDGVEHTRFNCTTPLLLKPSPKIRTPDKHKRDEGVAVKTSGIPLSRTPRGPPVDLKAKKEKKKGSKTVPLENDIKMSKQALLQGENSNFEAQIENNTSVRKTSNRSAGKFFKNSPKNRFSKPKEKEDMSWFELDDVFGFACED